MPRILLVADDPTEARTLPAILAGEGFDVHAAPDVPDGAHRFDLADWERGFALIASRHAGKVVLLP